MRSEGALPSSFSPGSSSDAAEALGSISWAAPHPAVPTMRAIAPRVVVRAKVEKEGVCFFQKVMPHLRGRCPNRA
jgi:hypothetical protein